MQINPHLAKLKRPSTSQQKRPLCTSYISTTTNPLFTTLSSYDTLYNSINITSINKAAAINCINSNLFRKCKKRPKFKFAHFYKTPSKYSKSISNQKSYEFKVEGKTLYPCMKSKLMLKPTFSNVNFKRCMTPVLPCFHNKFLSIDNDENGSYKNNISVVIKVRKRCSKI